MRNLILPFWGSIMIFPFVYLNAGENEKTNIIIIMCDDMGYSDLGCFGSEILTPNIDYLASNGLRFTQFYNCGRSCPTRASLMTGLYPHQAGVGEMIKDRNLPGYRGDLNKHSLTIAEILKSVGYNTYMAGKWHVTNVPYGDGMGLADKHNWPLQRGFERFYGTLHGAGSYWDPSALVRDNNFISPYTDREYRPNGEYYYTDAISDNAVKFIREHNNENPFFLYVAYTAPHWPMHAPQNEIDYYNGVYNVGYEDIRLQRYNKMKELGLINPSWNISRQEGDWNSIQSKDWEEKLMQTYAAMITIMDKGVGRIVDELRKQNQLENTLIFFLQDNGGCAEDTGRYESFPKEEKIESKNEFWFQTRGREVTRDGRVVKNGPMYMPGPDDTFMAYGKYWANVSNTPFRKYKSYVHEGGISTPLIVHWPKGIKVKSALRHSVGHVVDIMATCVDLLNIDYPTQNEGVSILPYEGRSLLPLFIEDFKEGERTIIFEHFGNSALRKGKWKIVGCDMFLGNEIKHDGWELYDMDNDRTETQDLSNIYPRKVEELVLLFENEARRTNILPKE